MANQYRTLTRDIAASLRSQNVDAAAAGVALDAFAQALPDGKLKASLGDPGSEQRAAAVEAVEAHLAEDDDGDDLGADDDTLSALASVAAEAAFAKDAVALGKCCRDAAQTLGEAEIPLLDRSDGDRVAAEAIACVATLCASVQLLEDDVGDESDWHAGALAGCYAALLAQTSRQAEAALDALDLLGFEGGGRDVRGFAEALARELHPQNIHIGHFIIDGGIKADHRPERNDPGDDSMLDPEAIANTYLQFHRQNRSSWSWEIELRPWLETF